MLLFFRSHNEFILLNPFSLFFAVAEKCSYVHVTGLVSRLQVQRQYATLSQSGQPIHLNHPCLPLARAGKCYALHVIPKQPASRIIKDQTIQIGVVQAQLNYHPATGDRAMGQDSQPYTILNPSPLRSIVYSTIFRQNTFKVV